MMAKVKDRDARQNYLKVTIKMGWSRNVLVHQIESQTYERHSWQTGNSLKSFLRSLDKSLGAWLDQQAHRKFRMRLKAILPSRLVQQIWSGLWENSSN
nr:hypothetical protein [Hahella sp. KA22]